MIHLYTPPTIFPVTADSISIFPITQAKSWNESYLLFFSRLTFNLLVNSVSFTCSIWSLLSKPPLSLTWIISMPSCVVACFYLSPIEEPDLSLIMSFFSSNPFHFPQNKSAYYDLWSLTCPPSANTLTYVQWTDLPQLSSSLSFSCISLLDVSQTHMKSIKHTKQSPIMCFALSIPSAKNAFSLFICIGVIITPLVLWQVWERCVHIYT